MDKKTGRKLAAALMSLALIFPFQAGRINADDTEEISETQNEQEENTESGTDETEEENSSSAEIPAEESDNQSESEMNTETPETSEENEPSNVKANEIEIEEENKEEGTEYSLTQDWLDTSKTSLLVEQEDAESSEAKMVDINETENIPENAAYKLTVAYKVPSDIELTARDVISFTLPDWIGTVNPSHGDLILSGSTDSVGTWNYDASASDRKIKLQFSEQAIETYGGRDIAGTLVIDGIIHTGESSSGTKTISLKLFDIGKDNISIQTRSHNLTNISIYQKAGNPVYRTGSNNEIEEVPYTLTVYAGILQTNSDQPDQNVQKNNKNLTNVTVNNAFTIQEKYKYDPNGQWHDVSDTAGWITYEIVNADVYDGSGHKDSNRNIKVTTDANGKFTVVSADGQPLSLAPDEKIVINYNAVVSDKFYQNDPKGAGGSEELHKGDQTNTIDRSWVSKIAYYTAGVKADGENEKTVSDSNKPAIKADKTWLWIGTEPEKNGHAEFKIAVNEAPRLDISDWVLDVDLSKYNEEIDSDIIIKYNGWDKPDAAVLSLEDLKSGNNLNKEGIGTFEGSSANHIKFKFASDNTYNLIFSVKHIESNNSAGNENTPIKASALLKDNDEHTYGAYKELYPAAATVTTRLDKANITENTISWQTTIDKDIGAEEGSVYRDFIGWEKNGNKGDLLGYKGVVNRTADNPVSEHHFDQDKVQLEVIYNENPDGNGTEETLTEGTDYDFNIIDADNWKTEEKTIGYGSDRLRDDYFSDCFQITFKKDFSGQIIIRFKSSVKFAETEKYTNSFRYWKTGIDNINNQYATGSADYTYEAKNVIEENVSSNNESGIIWNVKVNQTRAAASQLEVRDTLPQGLDFALTKDSFAFTEAWLTGNAGGNTADKYITAWNKAWDHNAIEGKKTTVSGDLAAEGLKGGFEVSYDSASRELRVLLKGDIDQKMIAFNIVTKPCLDDLKKLNGQESKLTYNNSVELYADKDENTPLASAGKECDITNKILTKGNPVYNAPYAEYTVTVNPQKVKLSESGTITLKDSWEESESSDRMILMQDSFTVNNKPLAEDMKLTIDAGGHGFELVLPDSETYSVKYRLYIVGTKGELPLENSAEILADGQRIVSEKNSVQQSLASPSGNVLFPNNIKIEKRSEKDPDTLLPGAEFQICEITIDASGKITKGESIGTVRTQVDGTVSTKNKNNWTDNDIHEIATSVVYGIYETRAPYGYARPDNADREPAAAFVFVDGNDTAAIKNYINQKITVIPVNKDGFTFTVFDAPLPYSPSLPVEPEEPVNPANPDNKPQPSEPAHVPDGTHDTVVDPSPSVPSEQMASDEVRSHRSARAVPDTGVRESSSNIGEIFVLAGILAAAIYLKRKIS